MVRSYGSVASQIFLGRVTDPLFFTQYLASGNHVIQKSVSILFDMAKEARDNGEHELCSFYLDSLDPIIDEIIGSVEQLSQHPYGCRAVQRMVEHCIEPQKTKILDSVIACQKNLLTHTYGNYVVQKVLAFGRMSDKDAIFRYITSNKSVIKFSKQKQASNVVEAMLRQGDANQRQQIVREIMNVSSQIFKFSSVSVGTNS